ncbi:MAG: flagellar hook-basal body complex protein, partial [Magnetococcales bacterium]|nr:flagellar hook-basal body complex protein [Magnetococcales bacterium]
MSIMQAMLAGSSALNTYSEAMTVIGNNLANANTTAFKSSRATFEDVLIQTVGISGTRAATQVGTGVGLSAIDQNMTQGAFNSTANVIDLSIDGRGFFEVKDPSPGAADSTTTTLPATSSNEDTFYTRAGDFKQDKSGKLVANNGLILQGWELTTDGIPASSQTADVDLSTFETSPPKASGLVDVGVNFNADEVVITDPLHTTYDPNDPASYNNSTTVRVYDSLGKGHNVDLHFKKLEATPATVNTTVGSAVDFSLSDANTDVTFKFTDAAGNVVTADAFNFADAGAQTAFDLTQLTTSGNPIALTAGTSYDISYTTSAGSLTNMVGADGVAEVAGNAWSWHAVASSDELVAGDRGTGTYTAVDLNNARAVDTTGLTAGYETGVLKFDSVGRLLSEGSTPITF